MIQGIYRDTLRLAWPVFIGQLAVMANGLIDTVMAGRYSTADLAAVGVGAAIYISVFIAAMGVLLALTPIAAQLYGAGRDAEIGEQVRQCAWLALALGAICVAALLRPEPIFAITQLAPEVEHKARDYLAAGAWGAPAQLLFRVFYGFSNAVSRPRPVMMMNLAGLALKVPLNGVLMYGAGGIPAMGGVGCAVSSSIIAWVSCVLAWTWCWFDRDYRRFGVFSRFSRPHAARLRHIVALGLPIGLTFFVDVTGFTFMALFIARLGALNSAAHQIASNFAAVLFMLPLALGNAASVLVGQAIGARDAKRARASALAGMTIGLACALVLAVAVWFGSAPIAALYSNDAEVRALAGTLLALVAAYHVFDAVQAVAANVLRGYKRVVLPMLVYAVALWGVGLGGGWLLGLEGIDLPFVGAIAPIGAPGFWIASTASLALAGAAITFHLLRVSRA